MWTITVRSPNAEPRQYTLKPGNNTIGRMSGNDIVILDPSASRFHAKIEYDEDDGSLSLIDLGSTNGTFINRDRITEPRPLNEQDLIRIGQHTMDLVSDQSSGESRSLKNTQMLTRDLLLESLDQNAILLTEVATRLNTVLNIDTALREVSNLMKISMGADRSEVILAENLDQLSELGFATSIAHQAMEQRSAIIVHDAGQAYGQSASLLRIHAAMCVPVLSGDEILALIYVFKNRPRARPFTRRDMQLAIAIGHQTALTIQRMKLLERSSREEMITNLLQRFLSPQQAENILQDYLQSGELPGLTEHNLTILAAEISNSSELAERLGAMRFGQLLNQYYLGLTEVIFNNQGSLNKYIGDGLMGVFGMPQQPPNPEVRAVKTALEIFGKLKELNDNSDEEISIGIGLYTGQAMAGYVGTKEYIEFSVIGYPVNAAWGLEALARPNRIYIGDSTYQQAIDHFDIKPLGEVNIKDKDEHVKAYEVLGNRSK